MEQIAHIQVGFTSWNGRLDYDDSAVHCGEPMGADTYSVYAEDLVDYQWYDICPDCSQGYNNYTAI